MTRLLLVAAAAVLTFAAAPPSLAAQSGGELLAQGIRAYELREYDGGAYLLRRALTVQGSGALSASETTRALAYLAATEVSRNQRDSALAAVRRLQIHDPRYRPDERVFSPQVVALYQEARRTGPSIAVRAVGDTAFRPGNGAFVLRLTAPSPAEVTATLTGPDGRAVRTLFAGPVRDSIDLRWNGLDVAGNVPAPGRYTLTVAPAGRDRRAGWSLRVPLDLARTGVDTMALPPPPADSLYRPERGNTKQAWRSLAPGLLAGAAIVVLPGIVANGEDASSARLLIGGAVSVAGLAAFVSQRPGRTINANSAHNRGLQERWRRDVADISRRNAERMKQSQLIIRVGAPSLTASEGS
jgi:hypothetical protein